MADTIIRLAGVHKGFVMPAGFRLVLANLDLEVGRGEFVTVVGPSGCGKSALVRLLIGLDRPDAGTVEVDGRKVDGPGAERGVVFQEPRLLPWRTVRQNVDLGLTNSGLSRAERAERVQEHLRLVELEEFADALPRQLSGGMAQRVAIARALVNRPTILLLDEPFSALDPLTRSTLQDALLRILDQEDLTVVMITHDVEEAVYLSDRIAVMRGGQGRILRDLPVALPRPRDRDSFEFTAVRRGVSSELRGNRPAGGPAELRTLNTTVERLRVAGGPKEAR